MRKNSQDMAAREKVRATGICLQVEEENKAAKWKAAPEQARRPVELINILGEKGEAKAESPAAVPLAAQIRVQHLISILERIGDAARCETLAPSALINRAASISRPLLGEVVAIPGNRLRNNPRQRRLELEAASRRQRKARAAAPNRKDRERDRPKVIRLVAPRLVAEQPAPPATAGAGVDN